jgi:hypothetical protein
MAIGKLNGQEIQKVPNRESTKENLGNCMYNCPFYAPMGAVISKSKYCEMQLGMILRRRVNAKRPSWTVLNI